MAVTDETPGENKQSNSIEGMKEPWLLLTTVRGLELPELGQYLQRFLDLVCQRPLTEGDVCSVALRQGRESRLPVTAARDQRVPWAWAAVHGAGLIVRGLAMQRWLGVRR